MDGATAADLATQHETSLDALRVAWDCYQEALSRYVTTKDGAAYRLLPEEELRQRSLACVRLLLHWREVAIEADLLETTSSGDENDRSAGTGSEPTVT